MINNVITLKLHDNRNVAKNFIRRVAGFAARDFLALPRGRLPKRILKINGLKFSKNASLALERPYKVVKH